MFTRIRIRNFKALRDVTVPLGPLTVLVGENSCGKTSVLQALDLLSAVAVRDINEYFADRGWTFETIFSQKCAISSIF